MATIPNNKAWKTVIEKHCSLPELWKVESDSHKNKSLRNKGWEELLILFKEVERNAAHDTMKKIITMRTCYRRELKKKLNSEKSGAGDDDIYEPTLWYFDELVFLRDQETQLPLDK